jgi:hypothetical protein
MCDHFLRSREGDFGVAIPVASFPLEPACTCDDFLMSECKRCEGWVSECVDIASAYINDCTNAQCDSFFITPEFSRSIGSNVTARNQFIFSVEAMLGLASGTLNCWVVNRRNSACMRKEPRCLAWHVTSDSSTVYKGGYCYLDLFKSEHHQMAMDRLGAWPSFADVLSLPSLTFKDYTDLAAMVISTDDFTDDAFGSEVGYDALTVLTVASHAMEYCVGPKSMAMRLKKLDCTTLEIVLPKPHALLGGRTPRDWHVSFDYDGGSSEPTGYCYLSLFRWVLRKEIATILGAFPTFAQILAFDRNAFVRSKRMNYLQLVVTHDGMKFGASAGAMLQVVATKMRSVAEHTMAADIYKYRRVSNVSDLWFPEPTDTVGSSFLGNIREVRRFMYTREAYKPPMDVTDADAIYDVTMKTWGLPRTPEVEEEVLTGLATIFVRGTSDEALRKASLEYNGVLCPVVTLCDNAAKVVPALNAGRIWVKSFRRGEMVLRIAGLLSNTANVALRQYAAMKYKTSMHYVELCFDVSKALKYLSPSHRTEHIFWRLMYRLLLPGYPPSYWRQFVLGRDDE